MSLWRRLRRALGGAGAVEPALPARDPDRREDDDAQVRQGRAPSGPGSELGLRRIERLIEAGHTGEAVELLSRMGARRPEDVALLLRLSEVLCGRREFERAAPLLRQVVDALPEGAPSRSHARVLLAEALLATGAALEALAQVEEVLAQDIDHPRARVLHERLGRQEPPGSPGAAPLLPAPVPAEAQALPTLLGVGGVRHQRYVLVRELGRGSAGTVYLARDTELEAELAIKIFHPLARARAQQDAAARAWNEARLTAAVRHPGVVAIYDLDDARALMVMELCRGGTLRQRLKGGRLPARVALRRAAELLDTLVAVHRTAVVHGDLKPGNLLFRGGSGAGGARQEGGEDEAYGDLVIADFGVARLLAGEEPADAASTSSGAGTLGYIAPERRRGRTLGPEADLYAVGVILVEMLLGALPLSRLGLLRGERLQVALTGEAAVELGPDLPAVEALLRGLLDEDPAVRPDAAAALAVLRRILGG